MDEKFTNKINFSNSKKIKLFHTCKDGFISKKYRYIFHECLLKNIRNSSDNLFSELSNFNFKTVYFENFYRPNGDF
nr:hypothetical protein 1634Bnrm2_p024 [Cryptomonas sp.]